ncbi:unnamed protein product [Rotaria sp. Silwood2]|nr:unnamed protein product [Rotaria sp. Silwood2]CAF2810063.1 unnamed protein product [Rotaria sp. Silwood2]CAF2835021.1 unnamed protein product [Rotaria sp. Silwood2]CAF3258698.1 unnamed protein product [Rotaria sp. Silwood2]CAF4060562.1 unnamed protein product [Rotaria sp. Silwood2]
MKHFSSEINQFFKELSMNGKYLQDPQIKSIDNLLRTIQQNDDVGQRFLLNTCTDYIYSHSTDKQYKQCLIDIRQSLLRPFTEWLIQQSSLFRLWNNRMIINLRQICFLLIQLNRFIILDIMIY